jgi:hypothetical protein
MSTLLTAVEIANCLDNGGGRVVWQRQSRRMVSVEKRHRMDRSGGHEGCGRQSHHGRRQRWNWAALTVKVVRL